MDAHLKIKIADKEDLFDLRLCAKEFLDFIEDFKNKFLNKIYIVLTACYDKILAGILVSEDKSHKIDSLEKIVPVVYLHLLFVNSKFRNNSIGRNILDYFLSLQKQRGIAAIYVKLPQKYKKGIKFFQKNDFDIVSKDGNKIILELNLWNDYGIRNCNLIGDNELFFS